MQELILSEPINAQPSTINLSAAIDRLSAADWSLILNVTPHAIRKAAGVAGDIPRTLLPAAYQETISAKLIEHSAASCRDLCAMIRVDRPAWTPPKPFKSYPPATQERALKKQEVLRAYHETLAAGHPPAIAMQDAVKATRHLFAVEFAEKEERTKKVPSDDSLARNIRNWIATIEERGGFGNARPEAFCDDKSCAHISARLVNKIPRALIQDFQAKCVSTARMSDAYRAIVIDWDMGREVPGLGHRIGRQSFPFTYDQLVKFAPSNAARQMGFYGKARARARFLPHMETTTANLRRAEMYLLDDTRLDIIALDDLTGQPVELKCYIMMDLASRRIEGWTIVEGSIQSRHVEALVARVLRSTGVGRNYPTTIIFERGTVACSPARATYLESCFPGRLTIARTGMDGGKNHKGDYKQSGSGHWMGKGHMESMVRTFVFFAGHLPGQRGNIYANQPAALGLTGCNRKSGALDYTSGSRMHDAVILAGAGRAVEYLEDGLESRITAFAADRCRNHGERLKFDSLKPVSWILQRITEAVAYYNARTDHRLEGFRRVEWQDEVTGGRRTRMESPDERAAWLSTEHATDRLSPADAAAIIRTSARAVTVTRQGVSFEIDDAKFRFWFPDSLAVAEAMRLSTGEKKYVALYDREALLQGTSSEIHLLQTNAHIPPGQERVWNDAPARYLESLPLEERSDRRNPEELAADAERHKRVEHRVAAELLRASAPILAEKLANAKMNIPVLREARETVVTRVNAEAGVIESAIKIPPTESAPTRRESQPAAGTATQSFIQANLPDAAPQAEEEPQVI